jgi:AcrR family transcriptional regulator
MPTSQRPSPRERLLEAADQLFYAEGVHTVGIDRVIERAGVAKASLYSTFGSKEELVRAYLMRRHERKVARMTAHMDRHADPVEKVLSIFTYLGGLSKDPGFRGCAFMNANAESAEGSPAQEVADLDRAWVRSTVRDLLGQAGATDPESLAAQVVLLIDGATMASRLDRNLSAASTAQAVARTLLTGAGLIV